MTFVLLSSCQMCVRVDFSVEMLAMVYFFRGPYFLKITNETVQTLIPMGIKVRNFRVYFGKN